MLARNSIDETSDDHVLMENWQDYVLANALVANYLNILMIYASQPDFPLMKTPNPCTTYIKNATSFRETATQINENIRTTFINLFGDLNRVQSGLQHFPLHLKTILLLIKKGNNDSINTHLPKLLEKGEVLVNESLSILKNPQTRILLIKNLLVELESLIKVVDTAFTITFQIEDVKNQWFLFHELFTQLSMQAEKAIHNFILQFNWILEQFISFDIESNRDLIINLLKSKAINVDHTIDLLLIVAQTYIDIANDYSNDKITGNTHLVVTSTDQERKALIKQYRYELQPKAVQFARAALKRHEDFLHRTQNLEKTYDKFLDELSEKDLDILLQMD